MKYHLPVLFALLSTPVYAGDHSDTITRVRVNENGDVAFGTTSIPEHTCRDFGFYFVFSMSVPGATTMYSTLLTAEAQGKLVQILYSDSYQPIWPRRASCEGIMAKATSISILNQSVLP